ncbi:HRDC domain-containing protein [Salinibacterium sp. SYSU T00001]|uniref:ribonuclease D n=1 Tax=Homoserinimonas sedimenticola TaxID=2986805 RepID=UPI00223576CD|nr:HRDC domain-containing protein [Salinibacterium sedimenticola]MCW4384302.1 HRDC domain-containing protein [Salinibacterium sedimenticola]
MSAASVNESGGTYSVIETREDYLAAVERIAGGEGPLAIDAERASGYRYSQRAYLIQVFRRGAGTFLFDPPAIGSFAELNEAVHDVEWVFHAASQDLECLREVGLDPQRIFDTELGARLAGLPRVGLGTVVESLLGIHLAKEHSAADWSTRPLPASWLLYAALDVELLVDLREAVARLLEEQDKSEIADQEFAEVLNRTARPSSRGEGWRRLSGVHSIRNPRNLAVAKALWEARDAYARETDVAPGRLVPDASLVAAAKALPASKRELASLKEFIGRASRSELGRWWSAIEEGKAAEELPSLRVPGVETIPPPKAWADRNPDADRRLKAARPRVVERAEALSLPVENLLTPDTLRRVAWTPPEPLTVESLVVALANLGARPWQIDATVQIIHDAFVEASQGVSEGEESPS